MHTLHTTSDEQFDADVRSAGGLVLVDCWASWCPPCKMMQPVVERLAEELADRVKVVALNVDQNPRAAGALQVENVPTFVLFDSGVEVARRSGAMTVNQLRELVGAASGGATSQGPPA